MDDHRDASRKLAVLIASNKDVTLDDVRTAVDDAKHAIEVENKLLEGVCKVLQEECKASYGKASVLLKQCKDEERQYEGRLGPWDSWIVGVKSPAAEITCMLGNEGTPRQDYGTLVVRLERVRGCMWAIRLRLSATSILSAIDQQSRFQTAEEKQLNMSHRACSMNRSFKRPYTLVRWMTFAALFGSSYTLPIPIGSTGDNSDRHVRRLSTFTEDMITIFLVLYPSAILLGTIKAAQAFNRKAQDGRTACAMLVMVYIFAAVPGERGLDQYARTVIGLAYAYLMGAYCYLVAMKNGWRREGCCTFAGVFAIIMIVSALSLAPVRNYLAGLAGTSILFGLSLAVPLAVAMGDTASFLLPRVVVIVRTLYGLLGPA